MRKIIIIVLLIVLCVISWYGNNYIFVDNKFEKVFYPENGMVQTERDAINLCRMYFQSIYGIEVPAESLCVQYYKYMDAWFVQSIDEKNDFQTVDGKCSFLIKKRNGKVLMHSIY